MRLILICQYYKTMFIVMFTFIHPTCMSNLPRRRRCPRRPRHPSPIEKYGMLRRDVAMQCFEGSTPAVAVARLRRWMRSDPEMWNELQSAGYRPYSRRFTPEQVSVLRRYLL